MGQLGIPAAFIAGLISFLSPCVLPLVPGYVSMISGASLEELKEGRDAGLLARVFRNSLAFILGFTLVFVMLGASATWVGKALLEQKTIFNIVAGVLIIIFGIHLTGLVKIPFLYREARIHSQSSRRGLAGSFLIGLAFALDGQYRRVFSCGPGGCRCNCHSGRHGLAHLGEAAVSERPSAQATAAIRRRGAAVGDDPVRTDTAGSVTASLLP